MGAVAASHGPRARGRVRLREPAYIAALVEADPGELVGVDLAAAEVPGFETVVADARSLPFPDRSFDQVLLVSTLEHIGADNEVYGVEGEPDDSGRAAALRELRRILRPPGSLLVTVPLGEPGDYGWFRQEDVRGWTRLFTDAGFFVEEQEAYELGEDGWRSAPTFDPAGVVYGTRGPAARRCSVPSSARGGCGGSSRPTACGAPPGGGSGRRTASCAAPSGERVDQAVCVIRC